MQRRRTGFMRASASVLAGVCALAQTAAGGELPEIASRLPADADASVIVPSIEHLDARSSQLLAAMQVTNLSSIEQLLTVMGARNGLDLSRGAAAVLDLPEEDGAPVGMVFLVPVNDYTVFASNFVKDIGAQRPGISRFEYFERPYFIKSLDGRYAIIGETAESVRTYEPSGDTARLEQMIGASGASAVSSSDVSLVVDVESSSAYVRRLMDRPEVAGALSRLPGGFGVRGMAEARVDELLRDGRGLALSATPGQLGLSMGAVVNYREGSKTHTLCQRGTEERLIEGLPAGETFLVGGVDLDHPAMERWFAGLATDSWLEGVHAVSMAAYMPPPPFMASGGADRVVIRYESDDPKVQLAALAEALTDEDAPTHRGEHAEAYKEYDGVPINGWSYFPKQSGMIHPAIIGQDGDILGASSAREGAGYVFTTRDRSLIRASMGLDASERLLESDRVMRQVRGLLPENPSLELFVSPKSLLDEFASVIGMFIPEFRVLPQVPPVGMNVTIGGGSAVGSAFVPAPTLSHGIEIFQGIVMPSLR